MDEKELHGFILNKKKQLQEYHPDTWGGKPEIVCRIVDDLLANCPL
jgi:hypothetical protein